MSLRAAPAKNEGFTLLELLVVLVILGLLAAVVTPQVLNYLGRARTQAAALQIHSLSEALDLYRLDIGRYPSEQEGLGALVQSPTGVRNWFGPYVKKPQMLVDPWGRPYQYHPREGSVGFGLYSLGADNAPGGQGEGQDITN